MLFQNLIGAVILGMVIWSSRDRLQEQLVLDREHWVLHLARVVTAVAGIAIWYMSLRYIPLTQVIALSFIAPIVTTIGAVLFLREEFNWQRGTVVLLSIAGGFLMTRPDRTLSALESFSVYFAFPIIAAIIFAFDKIFTKRLIKHNVSLLLMTWYLLFFSGAICLAPVLQYGWVSPNLPQLGLLFLLGLLGICAHYTFNKAYEFADVTLLLPFGMSKLLISAGLSYMIFNEIPRSADVWIGIIVISLSSMLLGIQARHISRMSLQQRATV